MCESVLELCVYSFPFSFSVSNSNSRQHINMSWADLVIDFCPACWVSQDAGPLWGIPFHPAELCCCFPRQLSWTMVTTLVGGAWFIPSPGTTALFAGKHKQGEGWILCICNRTGLLQRFKSDPLCIFTLQKRASVLFPYNSGVTFSPSPEWKEHRWLPHAQTSLGVPSLVSSSLLSAPQGEADWKRCKLGLVLASGAQQPAITMIT